VHTTWTLASEHRLETEIRKSRFLAQAAPVDSVQAALAYIERASDAGASHNCWAYRMGPEYRFSDDGEPGGSAGKPILQAIEGQDMDGVVVVVSRWFGGTKLGVGGLIRAYGGTAAECLRLAQRKAIVDTVRISLHLGYAELPILKARTRDWLFTIDDEHFGADTVQLHAQIERKRLAELECLVRDLTRGAGRVHPLDTEPRHPS